MEKKRLILETIFVLSLILISLYLITFVTAHKVQTNPTATPANGTYLKQNTTTYINCTFDLNNTVDTLDNLTFKNASLWIANISGTITRSNFNMTWNSTNDSLSVSAGQLYNMNEDIADLNGTSNASVAVIWKINETFKLPGEYLYNCRVSLDNTSIGASTPESSNNWSSLVNTTIVMDWHNPNVTAVTPVNSSNLDPDSTNWSDATVNFSAYVADENIANCTLYGDFNGTMAINKTIGIGQTTGITNNANNDIAQLTLASNTTGYAWYIKCDDLAGNTATNVTIGANIPNTGNLSRLNTTIYILKVDGDAPSLTISPSASKTLQQGQSQAVSCTQNDGIGVGTVTLTVGGVEQTCSEGEGKSACTATYVAASTGDYVMKCTGADNLGNAATAAEITLSVEGGVTGPGGPTGPGPSPPQPVEDVTQEPIILQAGSDNPPWDLNWNGNLYPTKVESVTATTATISTGSVTNDYAIGDTKEIDLDGDGEGDIELTLNDISMGKAVFTIKEVEVKIAEEAGVGEEEAEGVTGVIKRPGVILGIIIAIIVILAGLYYFTRKK